MRTSGPAVLPLLVAVALFSALVSVGLLGCKKPELTIERVMQEMSANDNDKLWLRFVTVPDNNKISCKAQPTLKVAPDEQDIAIRAGWIERKCPDNPVQMRIPKDAYGRSMAWKHEWVPVEFEGIKEDWAAWRVPMAWWVPRGVPRIGPGDSASERRVVLPGRWNTTEDGRMAQFLKWQTINVTERQVVFVYADGRWSLKH